MAGNYKTREERRRNQGKSAVTKKKTKSKNLFKKLILLIFIIGIAGLAVGAGTFAWYVKDTPKLDKKALIDPVSSEIIDMNGDVYTTLGVEKRDYIDFDHIPDHVKDAILATEDVRFYKHGGIDFKRLAGAVMANVSRGFGSEGASTITQQVVKGSFLTTDKTLKRKAQEAWLAIQLEKNYTKEQIFEIYVNKINYANGIYGIETASKYYFDKPLDELELHEAAFLAGMPQSPSNYEPYEHPDRADKRKNIVLTLMEKHGKITKKQMEEAQKKSITDSLIPEEHVSNANKIDSFVDQVIREVESMGDYDVFSDGLKIYTTLDPAAQEYTDKMLKTNEIVQFPDDEMQAGIVLTDTKTGEIRAIGGNRYQNVKRGKNFATTLSDRHAGSTVKPIFDYGPAIEYLNWSTYAQIVDEPYTYSKGVPINNFDRKHLGQMSIREALYRSRNIPALKAFQEVTPEKAKQFAANLGLEFEDVYESASIGGIEGISPLKLAGAFSAFGNGGVYNKPHTVKKIVLRDGETEIKNDVEPKIAMKDSTAYMVTDMLKDVLSDKQGATGRIARVPGLPVAGKTGTTNYSAEEISKYKIPRGGVPDAWFAGYTTNYTAAVWTGYEQRKNPLRNDQGRTDQQIAMKLFSQLMSHVSDGADTPDFKMPKSVVKAAVEKGSNPAKKPSEFTPKDNIIYELFVAGTEPTEVSETFDKLDAPSVTGEYHQAEEAVYFEWGHAEKEKDILFDVAIKSSDGFSQSLTQTSETSYTVTGVKPGVTYSIEVTAVLESQKSSPGTTSVTVPSFDQEDEGTAPPDEDKDKDKEKEKEKDKEKEDKDQNNGGNEDGGNGEGEGGGNGEGDGGGDSGGSQDPGNPGGDNGGTSGTGNQGRTGRP